MNTKQLWQALSFHPLTLKVFSGIFPKDMLKEMKNKPNLVICNIDPSYKKGKHWVLFYFNDDGTVDFYDSLGRDIIYYGRDFVNFLDKFVKVYYYTNVRTQPKNTDICGEMCLYYALLKCRGYNMEMIIERMLKTDEVLKVVKCEFKYQKKSNGKCLQKCICK